MQTQDSIRNRERSSCGKYQLRYLIRAHLSANSRDIKASTSQLVQYMSLNSETLDLLRGLRRGIEYM